MNAVDETPHVAVTFVREAVPAARRCPCCRVVPNASVDVDAGEIYTPRPGDLTVCMHCFAVLEFGPELALQRLELATLPADVRARIEHVLAELEAACVGLEQIGGAP